MRSIVTKGERSRVPRGGEDASPIAGYLAHADADAVAEVNWDDALTEDALRNLFQLIDAKLLFERVVCDGEADASREPGDVLRGAAFDGVQHELAAEAEVAARAHPAE